MEENNPLIYSPEEVNTETIINRPSKEVSDVCNKRPITRRVTVEPVVLCVVFMMASAGIPTQYVYQRMAEELNYTQFSTAEGSQCYNQSEEEMHQQQEVQEASTFYVMFNAVASILPGIIATVFIGSYSDKAGRKCGILPQIVFCCIRLLLQIIVIAVDLPLYLLIVASLVGGLAGGEHCILMISYAYIADITSEEQRSFRIFILLITMILGGTVAALGVSYLIVGLKFLYAAICFIPLYILTFLYVAFILPEPIIKDPTARLFQCTHFCRAFRIYKKKTTPPRTLKLLLCVIIVVIGNYTSTGSLETYTLYFFNEPFCWGTLAVGYYLAYLLLIHGIAGLVIVYFTTSKVSDEVRIILGSVSGILYFIAIGLAKHSTQAFIAPVFGIATSLMSPMARSAATKLVHADEQGRLQATMSPVEQAGAFASTWVSNILYVESVRLNIHGFLYFVLAGLVGVSLIIAIALYILSIRDFKKTATVEDHTSINTSKEEEDGGDGQ